MVRVLALFCAALLVAPLSAQAPGAAPATLPVTRVVLYKSGVAYTEHLSNVTGDQQLAVQFTAAQLDDVLKSLTTVDLGAGRVVAVSYDSPTPIDRRLQGLSLPLGQRPTTLGLLTVLRGASLEVRSPSGPMRAGRLLNVERRTRVNDGRSVDVDELTLVTDQGDIVTMALGAGSAVRVMDAGLRREIGEYLEAAGTVRGNDTRRLVISTSGTGVRPLLVSYVSEAAVWKTTYRLVFGAQGRSPLLQGWAIVDNLSAQDWQNVELSLMAGAPQSFVQPLSRPLFTRRPAVGLPSGLLPTPQLHDPTLVSGPGRVAGIVRDASGRALAGVRVVARDASNRQVGSAVTDRQGRYQLPSVPSGEISLRAELAGFSASLVSGIDLQAGDSLDQDVVLRPGAVEETVEASGQAPRAVGSLALGSVEGRVAGGVVGGVAGGTGGGRAGGLFAAPPPPPPPGARTRDQLEQALSAAPAASASDLGDLFEYRLTDRVTIRRNESALVPILQADVKAERVSLWNSTMGTRPRRAVCSRTPAR